MKRINALRGQMEKRGISRYFVTEISDIYYLSGFTGSTACLLVTEQNAIFFTDGRYDEQCRYELFAGIDIMIVSEYAKEISATIKGSTLTLSPGAPLSWREAFVTSGTDVAVDMDDCVKLLRRVKDDAEVELIREQYRIAGGAFEECLTKFIPGRTEAQWAADLEYAMKARGARGSSFDPLISSGARGSMCHGIASSKVVEKDDPVIVDFGSRIKYASDITRHIYNGKDPEVLSIISLVHDALQMALAGIKAGMICNEIDAIARGHIRKHGYDFNHGLGHSIGIDVHENPRFNMRDTTVLEPNMILTVEPGIYLPGRFGVRLEDTVRVTENGCEILSRVLDRYVYQTI